MHSVLRHLLAVSLGSALSFGATVTFSNTTSISIPTSGAASVYPSTINVSGVTGLLSNVTATLSSLSHTFPDDLDVLLVGPSGVKVLLMSDTGGTVDIVNVTLTFSDGAASNLPDSTFISTGSYRPTNIGAGDTFTAPAPASPFSSALSAFSGSDPNGTWSLYILDDTGGDTGVLAAGWSLTITDDGGAPLPEPGSWALMGGGLAGLLAWKRRRMS